MARFVTGKDEENNVRRDASRDDQYGGSFTPPTDASGMRSDIAAAAQMRSEFDDVWKLCYDAYRNNLTTSWSSEPVLHDEIADWVHGDLPDPRTHIPLVKPVVDSVVAALATRAPKFAVMAERPEYEAAATIAELVSTWWWELYGGMPAWKDATFDSVVCGHGWMKVAWRLNEETEPISEEEIEARVQSVLDDAATYAGVDPDAAMPDEAEVRRQVVAEAEQNPHVLSFVEHPVYQRVSVFDMFVDPEATSMRDAAWLVQRYWEPLSEVRTNERYDKMARQEVIAAGRYHFGDMREGERTGADDRYTNMMGPEGHGSAGRAQLWEYHDLRTGQWCVFGEGTDRFLIEPRPSPFADTPFKCPYRMIERYSISEDLYPLGDVAPMIGLQLEMDDTRSQQMTHRQQLAQKYVVSSEIMADEANRAALKSNRPGEVLIARGNMPIEALIQPLPTPNIPTDFYAMTDVIHQDVERVTGVTELMRGMSNVSRRTATEANLLSDAISGRLGQQLELHQQIAAELGHMSIVLAQLFMSQEALVPLVGADLSQQWVQFSADDIAGQYHFRVQYGTMQPRDDAANQQKAVQLMQLLAPLIGVSVNPFAIARYVLEAYDVPRPEQFILDPQQQQGYAQEQAMLTEAQTPPRPGAGGAGGVSGPGGGPGPMPDASALLQQSAPAGIDGGNLMPAEGGA